MKLPLKNNFNSPKIIKKLIEAHRALAVLKWNSKIIPNQKILINSLALQEAKDSSAIENIITTHDELYLSNVDKKHLSKEIKEVQSYKDALVRWFEIVKDLLEILFSHPYTKIEFVVEWLIVSRKTAAKYLNEMVNVWYLKAFEYWKSKYFVNLELFELLKKWHDY